MVVVPRYCSTVRDYLIPRLTTMSMVSTCPPCDGLCCACHEQRNGLQQSLAEVEFMHSASRAAQDGNLSKLEQLVNKNPHRLCASDSTGYTPLHYAARGGHVECVRFLLQERACVDARTSGGATALHRAAFIGKDVICSLLLQAKASAIIQDSDGQTPLHKAAMQRHESTVRLLFLVCACQT